MKTSALQVPERLNLLLIGNNPIEMGYVIEKIQQVQLPEGKIAIEIAFDLKTMQERLSNFKPAFIIIDDNIGKTDLMEMVLTLAQNRKTKDTPITVLKNSNYEESSGAFAVVDYVLKQNFNSTSLMNTFRNSIKFRRTYIDLQQAYTRRKPAHLSR